MATIFQTDGAITSVPADTPKIVALGDIFISDSFNRNGELQDSTTDSFKGGISAVWQGTNGNANTTSTTNGGQLVLGSTTLFSQCVDAGRPDLSMSFKFLGDTLNRAPGQNSMIEFRKAQATTGDTLRLTLGTYIASTNATIATLTKRVNNIASAIGTASFNMHVGKTYKIDLKGSSIKIYADEVLVVDVTDSSILTGNFFGFAGSNATKPFTVSEFTLRSLAS